MSNNKKPYIRTKSKTKFIAIFNEGNRPFASSLIEFCGRNNIHCKLDKPTQSGHIKYIVNATPTEIVKVKEYIKNTYLEFCHYNKEMKHFIKS